MSDGTMCVKGILCISRDSQGPVLASDCRSRASLEPCRLQDWRCVIGVAHRGHGAGRGTAIYAGVPGEGSEAGAARAVPLALTRALAMRAFSEPALN